MAFRLEPWPPAVCGSPVPTQEPSPVPSRFRRHARCGCPPRQPGRGGTVEPRQQRQEQQQQLVLQRPTGHQQQRVRGTLRSTGPEDHAAAAAVAAPGRFTESAGRPAAGEQRGSRAVDVRAAGHRNVRAGSGLTEASSGPPLSTTAGPEAPHSLECGASCFRASRAAARRAAKLPLASSGAPGDDPTA